MSFITTLQIPLKAALHDANEIIADMQSAIAKWPTFAMKHLIY